MRNELAAAGNAPVDTELFRTLFQQRLPQPVRAALALLPTDSTLDVLAEAADRYMDASGPDPRISAVTAPPPPAAPPAASAPAPSGLEAVVTTLVAKMEQLEASNQRLENTFRRDRARSPSRRRQPSRPSRPPTPARPSAARDNVCWYHQKFGVRARRCEPPCSWEAEN